MVRGDVRINWLQQSAAANSYSKSYAPLLDAAAFQLQPPYGPIMGGSGVSELGWWVWCIPQLLTLKLKPSNVRESHKTKGVNYFMCNPSRRSTAGVDLHITDKHCTHVHSHTHTHTLAHTHTHTHTLAHTHTHSHTHTHTHTHIHTHTHTCTHTCILTCDCECCPTFQIVT